MVAASTAAFEVDTDPIRGVILVRAGQITSIFAAVVALSMWSINSFAESPERTLVAESREWPNAAAVVTRGARWCSVSGQWVKRNVKDRSLCVDYEYRVGDETFEKTSATVWQHLGSPFPDSDNQYVIDAFQVGASLIIRYDPMAPGTSAVTPKGPSMEGWNTSFMWTGFWVAVSTWLSLTLGLFLQLRRQSRAVLPDGTSPIVNPS